MSNRLQNNERMPFITDAAIAGGVSQLIIDTRARALQVRELGDVASGFFSAIPRALNSLFEAVQAAENRRDYVAPAFPGIRFTTNQLPDAGMRTRILGIG